MCKTSVYICNISRSTCVSAGTVSWPSNSQEVEKGSERFSWYMKMVKKVYPSFSKSNVFCPTSSRELFISLWYKTKKRNIHIWKRLNNMFYNFLHLRGFSFKSSSSSGGVRSLSCNRVSASNIFSYWIFQKPSTPELHHQPTAKGRGCFVKKLIIRWVAAAYIAVASLHCCFGVVPALYFIQKQRR